MRSSNNEDEGRDYRKEYVIDGKIHNPLLEGGYFESLRGGRMHWLQVKDLAPVKSKHKSYRTIKTMINRVGIAQPKFKQESPIIISFQFFSLDLVLPVTKLNLASVGSA